MSPNTVFGQLKKISKISTVLNLKAKLYCIMSYTNCPTENFALFEEEEEEEEVRDDFQC